ncbi:hypothetical protein DUNSADRAFT_6731 [Dunaliella salina]|uniref:Uncharacterized protein n=1 Tax=Dunaliella salina TaxID=3046 RepID=A0ABQ7H6J7_DUNSA|nr:hypothetical protein DUNSADRAFT_6731 [Dunaliella salina]|eukprot:KAF5842487.1 hypothetical protein DUNSADRAFT_6731 [Dunaliella salina]
MDPSPEQEAMAEGPTQTSASPVPEDGEDDAVQEDLQDQDGACSRTGEGEQGLFDDEEQQGELKVDQQGRDPVEEEQHDEEEEEEEQQEEEDLEQHREHSEREGERDGKDGAEAKATPPPQQQLRAPQQELPPVILITTVDIGGGKSDCIELRKGGDPTSAARTFCEKHSLPPHIIAPLTQHILDNLSKAKQQESLRHSGETTPQAPPSDSPPSYEEEAQQQLLEQPPPAQVPSRPSTAGSDQNAKQKLSFANPNDRLYEQLSQKLMPVNDSERMLTVNSVGRHPTSGNRNAQSRRISASADVGVPSYLRGSYTPRDTVHLRLYEGASELRRRQEAKRKAQQVEEARGINQSRSSMSWISQEMMRARSHGPFENYGEMLYAEGLEQAAVKNSRAVAERAEREARETEGATFRPEVSKLARALWSGGDLNSQACWQRLSVDKRSKTLEAIKELKANREKAELDECTFKPKVNATSAALMADRSETLQMLRMSAHEQLFQDALRRQQKRDELEGWLPEEVTFKPKVNMSPQAALHLSRSFGHMGLTPPLSPTKKMQKQQEARERAYGDIDPVTGKQLYRPEVGRAPRNVERNPHGAPIGEILYLNALEERRRKEAMKEAEKEAARRQAEAHHSTATSSKLFARLKNKRFNQIFDYLDEYGNGLLDVVGLVRNSTEHMDNLDIEVREDVELAAEAHAHACRVPLLPSEAVLATATPEEQQQAVAALPPCPPVDLQTFSSLMEGALLRKRKPRAYLVPSPTNKSVPSHPFKPNINKRSKKMAARLRPAELSPHDILHYNAEAVRTKHEALRKAMKDEVRTKHEALRKAMKDEALRGCTFRPRLNSNFINGRPVEGKALRSSGYGVGSSMNTPRRSVPPLPEGAMLLDEKTQQLAAMREMGPVSGDEMSHFRALEAEVEDALAGVSGSHSRLSELDQGEPSPQAEQEEHDLQQPEQPPQQQQHHHQQVQGTPAGAEEKPHTPDVSQVLKARLPPGSEVDPRDMRATEEFLLDMLGQAGPPGSDEGGPDAAAPSKGSAEEAIQAEMMAALEPGSGKSDAEVLEILQKHLASTAGQQQQQQQPQQQQQQQQQAAPRTSRASLSTLSGSGGIGSNGRRSANPSASNSGRMRTEIEPYGSLGGAADDVGTHHHGQWQHAHGQRGHAPPLTDLPTAPTAAAAAARAWARTQCWQQRRQGGHVGGAGSFAGAVGPCARAISALRGGAEHAAVGLHKAC